MKTRKAIRKAIQNQLDGKGFSFVEILSPCPTGWKLDALASCRFILEQMLPVYPAEVFKDESETREPRSIEVKQVAEEDIPELLDLGMLGEPFPKDETFINSFPTLRYKFAGFGGQGVLTAGVILAATGMQEHLQVSWIPSYGPEMRGGTANCSVVLSKEPIGSPMVVEPDVLAVMNDPSMDTFEQTLRPGGLMIVNSSIIARKAKRDDIDVLYIPVTDIANKLGLTAAANMVFLGAYIEYSKLIPLEHLKQIVPRAIKRKQSADKNIEAVEAGARWVRENVSVKLEETVA
jgi:2-oxoisovalerate ferredoxin oxidoreductase beta subunit